MSVHGPELLAHYQGAAGRMGDLPMFNPALTVAMPGWRALADGTEAGVLITPWCINLLWVPAASLPGKGEPCILALPSGEYEGIVAVLEGGLRFGSASLVSDTTVLGNQAEAAELVREMEELIFAMPTPEEVADQPTMPARRQLFRSFMGNRE